MKGFMVVFFTQQNRRYQGKMLGEWIVDVAKEMGLRGATLLHWNRRVWTHRKAALIALF